MTIYSPTGVPVVSFTKIKENAQWFRSFLISNRIDISGNKFMQESIKLAEELETWSRSKEDYLKEYKLNSILSQSVGISYLISIIKKASTKKGFDKIRKLLRYFSKADPVFHKKGTSTQERNFLFELEIACLFLCCGHEVLSQKEPDVIVEEAESSTWDLSCKMIYSENSVTMADTLNHGVHQCISYDSTYGMVIAGLSNVIEHDIYLPILNEKNDIWGSYPNKEYAFSKLSKEITKCVENIKEQSINHFSEGRDNAKFRGIILLAHTICSLNGAPMTLSQVALVQRLDLYNNIIKGPEINFCKRFNDFAQTVFPSSD